MAVLMCTFAEGQGIAQVKAGNGGAIPDANSAGQIKISPGDLVDVQVFDTPELSTSKARVGQGGEVELPVLGSVGIGGMTPPEASDYIATQLHQHQYMLEPHVNVSITEYASQGIRVLGEVKLPGTYLLLGPHSLYDALSAAGGVTHEQGATITITHADHPELPQVIPVESPNYSDLERKTEVYPGDVVVVSRAEAIYVIGDVAHPGQFLMESGRPITVLNALALASGTNPTAAISKASIVRPTSDGKATTIRVNIKQVERNDSLDPVLQPRDVLVVPRSGFREFLSYSIPNATSAVMGSVAAALVVR
jgi:polysaccharide export outer membrane protein